MNQKKNLGGYLKTWYLVFIAAIGDGVNQRGFFHEAKWRKLQ